METNPLAPSYFSSQEVFLSTFARWYGIMNVALFKEQFESYFYPAN